MHGDFFLFERDGKAPERAAPLAFGETSGRDEAWLRDALLANPDINPVRDIDPSYGPLIPLCKELRTDAGPLDVAFINQFGRLTLVECKLWRNPEARRKVVAQVLDYARAISRWTYSDLQRQVAAATGRTGNVPFELVRERVPALEEHRFVDQTAAAMRSGRFLLLIAGDGIREDVGAMTELINRNAASGFAFGLVEVALYGLGDGGLAVQPRVIARTQIIERTVVLLRTADGQALVSEEDNGAPPPGATETGAADSNALGESPEQAAYRAWWTPVIQQKLDDPDQESPKLYWRNNVRTPLPWPGTWILAYRDTAAGTLNVCVSGRDEAFAALMSALEPWREEVLLDLPPGTRVDPLGGTRYNLRWTLKASDCATVSDQQSAIAAAINAFVNALRPRVKQLMAQAHDSGG